jgi:hypothetical protein
MHAASSSCSRSSPSSFAKMIQDRTVRRQRPRKTRNRDRKDRQFQRPPAYPRYASCVGPRPRNKEPYGARGASANVGTPPATGCRRSSPRRHCPIRSRSVRDTPLPSPSPSPTWSRRSARILTPPETPHHVLHHADAPIAWWPELSRIRFRSNACCRSVIGRPGPLAIGLAVPVEGHAGPAGA